MIPTKNSIQRQGIEILSSRQILQRLLLAPSQVKKGSRSKDLFNEIQQIACSLY